MRPAAQSSTWSTGVASRSTDNDLTTGSCTEGHLSSEPWLSVDLVTPSNVDRVCVTNDYDESYGYG